MIPLEPITFSAIVSAVLGLVDWKKTMRGLANDYVNNGARNLLGRLKRDEREKAAKQVIALFTTEFLGEIQDKTPLSSAEAGYHDQLRSLIEHAAPDIACWLKPETKDVDLAPVERMWDGLGLDPLPEDFDWSLVAKNYAREIRRYVKSHAPLRELLNTALLEQQTEIQQQAANTLTRMAGVDFGFDLAGYRDYLRRKCGLLQLAAMHTSTYDRRINLWSIFVPQSARQAAPVRELPRELLRRLQREGQLENGHDGVEMTRLRETYQRSPLVPVLEVLGRERLVVVTGDPGSGKTSLLKFLVMGWVNQGAEDSLTPVLPVWIDLKEYAKTRQGLLKFCETGNPTFRLDARKVDELLHAGRAALYLDGLDEIFDGPTRGSVIEETAALAARYGKATIVVTSRIVGYEPDRLANAGFVHATLEDFDNGQIHLFLTKWHDAAEENATERTRLQRQLKTALRESKAVRELAGNPLLLTMMAILNRTQALPRDRVELKQQASRVLLHEWDASRSLPVDSFARQEKEELLRELAGTMQMQEEGLAGNLIERSRLVDLFRGYLKNLGIPDPHGKATSVVNQLTERNFILCFAGADRFSFVHRAFLEYFCAAWFVEQFEKKRTLTLEQLRDDVFGVHWCEETWHEVLRLIAGMVGDKQAEELIVFLMGRDGRSHKLANWMLAAGCLSEIRNRRSIQATDEALSRLFTERAIRYDPPYYYEPFMEYAEAGPTRRKAVQMIGYAWRNENTRKWLSRAVQQDRDWIIRREAIQELAHGWREDRETLPLLKERACSDEDNAVRTAAVHEIARGWLDEPETLTWLVNCVRCDENYAVRRSALEELARGWRDDPVTQSLLKERASSDENYDVRRTAIQQLASGWKNDPETLPLLKKAAQQDENDDVRIAAIEELTKGWRDDRETLLWLKESLTSDEDSAVRRTVVQGLAYAWEGDGEAARWLKDRLRLDKHFEVRRAAVQELARGWKQDPETLPWLQNLAGADKNYDVRRTAIQELAQGWGENPETLILLNDRIRSDDNYGVRVAALQELARNWKEDPDTLGLLKDRAHLDANPAVRRAAVQALAGRGKNDQETLSWLSDRARCDEDSHVRRTAIRELVRGWRDDSETLPLLMDRARLDRENTVRMAAIQELARGWHDAADTLPLLKERARSDRGSGVRKAAILELGRAWKHDPDTRAVIRDGACSDGTPAVRRVALQELARGWPQDAETVLVLRERGSDDQSGEVRIEGIQWLARNWNGDAETLPWLMERGCSDENEDVRITVIQELTRKWKDDPGTLPWLKERARLDDSYAVHIAAVRELGRSWKEDVEVRELF